MPDEPSLERIRPRPRSDPIPVLASRSREPSIEPMWRPAHVSGDDLGCKHAIDRSLETFEIDVVGSDERCHLPSSVHAGVGSPRDGQLRLVTDDSTDRVGEDTLHRSLPSVPCPPPEPGPVVRESEPNDHVTQYGSRP